ncbi:hypothetical protein M409DRAFT_25597 [Zasmidium cellare ATCC 36951]|uniref:Peptidase S8/S53 domain-containing protein n=1 Tax=Zasmidium cellare ATCC 36951 TaxID=1080233 RepID=A0A6A6CAR3_ZASCE|nr:uncharacterized protein M409DRAFT_25597 [Zasmidium cellare ATCC 36951]KAF2164254.1 hypothetical protein M409DRAFT_25597 [Zasmidium cellare ATCC 36951]
MASPKPEDDIVSTSRVNSGTMSVEDEEDVSAKFRAIRDDLRASNHVNVDSIQQDYDVDIFTTLEKEGTLLHMMIDSLKHDFAKYEPLVETLTSREKIIYAKNSYQETVLYKAVREEAYHLVRFICRMNGLDIANLLALQTGDLTNCLHTAITNRKFDPDVLRLLIDKANDTALAGRDKDGRTALHLAVEYRRCTPARVPIVEALIQKFDKALEMETTAASRSLSPYRVHMLSRAAILSRLQQSRPQLSEASRSSMSELRKEFAEVTLREPNAVPQKPTTPLLNHNARPRPESKDDGGREGKRDAQAHRRHEREDERLRKTFEQEPHFKRGSDSVHSLGLAAQESEEGHRRSKDEPQATTGAEREGNSTKVQQDLTTVQKDKKAADEIRELMRLHFLRSRNDEQCIRFLYGPKQDREIYLNLLDHTSLELSRKSLEDSLGHLKFDEILRCVALPRMILHPDPATASSSVSRKNGRSDVLRLFQYLKEDKSLKESKETLPGVKRVLRVIVEDLSSPSHADEDIEAALKDLHVEDLDWRKYDMCPNTIKTAAPEAKRVSLYWSGSNAVLRGWSENCTGGGLNSMQNLRHVRLYYNIEHVLESKIRVRENVKDFKERLIDITVDEEEHLIHERCDLGHGSGLVGPTEAEKADKWLTPMDSFADFIQNVTLPAKFVLEDVIVGLVDDGVNLNERSLQSRVIDGRSFDANLGEEDLTRPYYGSTHGHGTAMASLICRLCPRAKLFVTRIESSPDGEISAESAAKAVRATIEQGVHIISMSWTIEKTSENVKGIEQLQDAILEARKKGILMFCAASDQGTERDDTYPGASSTTEIFKIGAARKWGNASKMVGNGSSISYLFPGEKVAPHRRSIDLLKNITLSGSSIATAIASGLAAMILFCVQVAAVDRETAKRGTVTPRDYAQVKRHDGRRKAFNNIESNPDTSPKYLGVWRLFDKASRKGDTRQNDGKIEVIAEVAAALVKGTKFEYD